MRILLITDSYPPEISSAAGLMKGLAKSLSDRGHQITVLTTAPAYKLHQGDVGKVWSDYSKEEEIAVLRVRTFAIHGVDYVRRGLGVILAPLQMWICLRRHVKVKFDSAFIYSPPVTLGILGYLLRRRGARVLLNVQDIFPQNAIDLGIMRNPLVIAFFRWVERFSYKHADVVTAHSKGNFSRLVSANAEASGKFRVLHNWVDTSYGAPRHNGYRKQFGLEGKYIALFAGVLGPSQGVHVLVDLALRFIDLKDLVFLVVGEGTEKQRAQELARSRGLNNIVFKPFVPQDDFASLLSEVDLGVVCLSPEVKTPVVPGKILGYMMAALPVAAFVNAESDVHELLADAGCGASCVSNDAAGMERIVRRLHGDREGARRMGRMGRQYAMKHFSKEQVVSEIERILDRGFSSNCEDKIPVGHAGPP